MREALGVIFRQIGILVTFEWYFKWPTYTQSHFTLKVVLIVRKPFSSDLNASSTDAAIFTVLGVGVYSTVILGDRGKHTRFFWYLSMFCFCVWCTKKTGLSSTETILAYFFRNAVMFDDFRGFTPNVKTLTRPIFSTCFKFWKFLCGLLGV